MSYEEAIQDMDAIHRKLNEYRTMLEFAKGNKTAQPMIPPLELAIANLEDLLRPSIRNPGFKRKELRKITIRATNLDYKIKDRDCKGIFYPEGNHFVFEMEETKRWFDRVGFPLRIGYLLIPEGIQCRYIITNVEFLKRRPRKTVLNAVPVDVA